MRQPVSEGKERRPCLTGPSRKTEMSDSHPRVQSKQVEHPRRACSVKNYDSIYLHQVTATIRMLPRTPQKQQQQQYCRALVVVLALSHRHTGSPKCKKSIFLHPHAHVHKSTEHSYILNVPRVCAYSYHEWCYLAHLVLPQLSFHRRQLVSDMSEHRKLASPVLSIENLPHVVCMSISSHHT